ncbi:E3 ubiquitin-protein ligase TRIM13 [Pelodytes ibericus]
MEMLEEDLTCPICCSLFDDPRILPCSHNFCKKCLEGVLEGNSRNMVWRPSSLKCPTCRKETTTMGVNGHQVNYLLKGIVEKYNKIKVAPKLPECKVHAGQPLNLFCSTDRKLICGFCATTGEHTGHVFSNIDDAYNQEKSSFQALYRGFEDLLCGEVLSHLDNLETNKRQALQLLTTDSDKVKAYFEKLQHVLEQKSNEILSDFETMKLAVMQAYDPEINKLNTVLFEQQKACNIAEGFKDISDPLLFLQQMQEFREKIVLIKEARLASATDVRVSPSMKNFDTRMWDSIKLADVDKLCLPQEAPTKKYKILLQIPYSFWDIVKGALLVVLMMAAFLYGSYDDHLQTISEYLYPLWSHLMEVMGKAADHLYSYSQLVAKELIRMIGMCQNCVMVFFGHVAQFICKYKL